MWRCVVGAVCLWGLAGPVLAMMPDIPLPAGATQTVEDTAASGRYALPMAPWNSADGLPTTVIEGAVSARAWRVRAGLTAQQIVRPIREALETAGWDIVLDCADVECGGFDFRFSTRVVPAPSMFVDIGAYRFVSAIGPDGSGIGVLASSDAAAGYLQIITASDDPLKTPATVETSVAPVSDRPVATLIDGDLIKTLETNGHVVLADLVFASGAASLAPGRVASLDRLADYLDQYPDRRILFVGHTDAEGSLEANQNLSRRRAQAALSYMREVHDLPVNRVGAEGAGFLSPVASNLTEAGRQANRRVDAVLLPMP